VMAAETFVSSIRRADPYYKPCGLDFEHRSSGWSREYLDRVAQALGVRYTPPSQLHHVEAALNAHLLHYVHRVGTALLEFCDHLLQQYDHRRTKEALKHSYTWEWSTPRRSRTLYEARQSLQSQLYWIKKELNEHSNEKCRMPEKGQSGEITGENMPESGAESAQLEKAHSLGLLYLLSVHVSPNSYADVDFGLLIEQPELRAYDPEAYTQLLQLYRHKVEPNLFTLANAEKARHTGEIVLLTMREALNPAPIPQAPSGNGNGKGKVERMIGLVESRLNEVKKWIDSHYCPRC